MNSTLETKLETKNSTESYGKLISLNFGKLFQTCEKTKKKKCGCGCVCGLRVWEWVCGCVGVCAFCASACVVVRVCADVWLWVSAWCVGASARVCVRGCVSVSVFSVE